MKLDSESVLDAINHCSWWSALSLARWTCLPNGTLNVLVSARTSYTGGQSSWHRHEKEPKKGVIASCGCCGDPPSASPRPFGIPIRVAPPQERTCLAPLVMSTILNLFYCYLAATTLSDLFLERVQRKCPITRANWSSVDNYWWIDGRWSVR